MLSKVIVAYTLGLIASFLASGIASVFFGFDFFKNLSLIVVMSLSLNIGVIAIFQIIGNATLRDTTIEAAFGFCGAGAIFAIWSQLTNFTGQTNQFLIASVYTVFPLFITPVWVLHFQGAFRSHIQSFRDGNQYAVGLILKAFDNQVRFFAGKDWTAWSVKAFLALWTICSLLGVLHFYGRWEVIVAMTLCSCLYWIAIATYSKSIAITRVLKAIAGEGSLDTKNRISFPMTEGSEIHKKPRERR